MPMFFDFTEDEMYDFAVMTPIEERVDVSMSLPVSLVSKISEFENKFKNLSKEDVYEEILNAGLTHFAEQKKKCESNS